MQLPDDSIKKRARKVVDAGSVTLAHLQESIATNEKLDLLLSKEAPEYPEIEIPEYPTELAISNLPEIQKVEITNLPEEKDDKETQNLLKELVAEVKKKEEYAYDIEIDSTLKEQLRGEKGSDGKNGDNGVDGLDGKEGSPDTPDQVVDKVLSSKKLIPQSKIEGLSDLERIAKANQGGSSTTFVNGKLSKNINFTGATVTTQGDTSTVAITGGGSSVDSFGIVVDGAGTAITTGSKGSKYIPWDCTITGWDIRSDVSGSCVFDVKRSGTSLAGSEKPTLSAAISNQDLALSTWTTSLLAGDVVEFVVDSASTITRVTATLLVTKI